MKTSNRLCRLIPILAIGFSLIASAAKAQPIDAPDGPIVQRYVDMAAEQAFDQWLQELQTAPRADELEHIGILRLDGDPGNLTSILQGKLSRLQDIRLVTLGGSVWRVIENELARIDPDEGYGDIFDKATILWREDEGMPDTTLGADAILLGHVRSIEQSWLRTIVRVQLFIARVDTREQLAGGLYTGEVVLSLRDAFFHYTGHIMGGVIILIGVIILLLILRNILRAMTRPR